MMQHENSLMPLSSSNLKIPKLFGFDIETYDSNRRFACASVVGENLVKQYFSKDDFINDLKTNHAFRNSFICATNLMFDFFGVFDRDKSYRQFSMLERQGNLIMAKGYIPQNPDKPIISKEILKTKGYEMKDYHPVTFIDSLSHLRASVEDMGQVINFRKAEKPEFLGQEPTTDEEWSVLAEYNKQDAAVTYKFMDWLAHMYNEMGCNLKMTISSTALDLFRRRYQGAAWRCPERKHVNDSYEAYYGGRTEAFNRGIFEERIKCYDANSLYPFCMREFRYPMMEDAYFMKKPSHDVIDSFMGVGYAELKAPDLNIPLLPVRSKKLLFPVGTIKGHYDFASLKKAMQLGYELDVLKDCWIYEHDFRPFRDYVSDIYRKRKEFQADKNPAELVAKLLLNSLYGKFGYQYKDKEIILPDDMAAEYDGDSSIIPLGLGTHLSRVISGENDRIPKYVFPSIPLYVTAYARIHMFDKMKSIGFDKILYTDTDSIFTRKQISTSSELGEFKLEKEFEQLYIIKPKMYGGMMRDGRLMTRIKGLHRFNYPVEDIRKVIEKGELNARLTNFRKLRGSFVHKCVVNETYSIDKSFDLIDDKRLWEKSVITQQPQQSMPLSL